MKPILEGLCEVEPSAAIVPGWMDENVPPSKFVLLPMPLMLDDGRDFLLPMSMHQRIFKWPARVGPINVAGGPPDMTSTPVELPQSDSGMPLMVMTSWPTADDPNPIDTLLPWDQPTERVPPTEQEGFGLRNVWTRDYPTAPLLNPLTGPGLNGSNVRFIIRGTTKDGTGTPLGGCTVIALRSGEMTAPLDPDAVVVDVEASDAGGAYNVQVPQNVPHQLIAYKPGSPDVAGVTVNTVMPEYL